MMAARQRCWPQPGSSWISRRGHPRRRISASHVASSAEYRHSTVSVFFFSLRSFCSESLQAGLNVNVDTVLCLRIQVWNREWCFNSPHWMLPVQTQYYVCRAASAAAAAGVPE
jgi:hypothetical protein